MMTVTAILRGDNLLEIAAQAAKLADELKLWSGTSLKWDDAGSGTEYGQRGQHVDGLGWSREWRVEGGK